MFHDGALCILPRLAEQIQLLPTEHGNVRRLKQVLSRLWSLNHMKAAIFLKS